MQYFLTNTETSVTYDTRCPFPDKQINLLHDYECFKKHRTLRIILQTVLLFLKKNYFYDVDLFGCNPKVNACLDGLNGLVLDYKIIAS